MRTMNDHTAPATRGALAALLTAALATAALLAGCASPAPAPTSPATASPTGTAAPTAAPFDVAAAKAYCVETGGEVQTRQPTFGTNNAESTWVAIGEPVDVCRYQTLGGGDDSRIYADLATIWSESPTLAALAYLAKPQIPADATGNPAAALCHAIGGAVDYGTSLAGGGLVETDDPIDVVVAACVFADGSFIDEWGIAYFGGDVVRGKDLTGVFRFDQSMLPDVRF